ncbi:hypothetical protein BJ741DRAFT_668282 [Chytriomyces cf. hyalinus JEL632]|nr:hypothetical protein BJ741DRAFT_668282 [Chytriomyces cf. hyalinus JEL632]
MQSNNALQFVRSAVTENSFARALVAFTKLSQADKTEFAKTAEATTLARNIAERGLLFSLSSSRPLLNTASIAALHQELPNSPDAQSAHVKSLFGDRKVSYAVLESVKRKPMHASVKGAVILGLARLGSADVSLKLVDKWIKKDDDVKANLHVLEGIVSQVSFDNGVDVREAERLFELLKKVEGYAVPVTMYLRLATGFAHSGDLESTMKYLKEYMSVSGAKPEREYYKILITVYSKLGNPASAALAHQSLRDAGFFADEADLKNLIDVHGRSGDVEAAVKYFKECLAPQVDRSKPADTETDAASKPDTKPQSLQFFKPGAKMNAALIETYATNNQLANAWNHWRKSFGTLSGLKFGLAPNAFAESIAAHYLKVPDYTQAIAAAENAAHLGVKRFHMAHTGFSGSMVLKGLVQLSSNPSRDEASRARAAAMVPELVAALHQAPPAPLATFEPFLEPVVKAVAVPKTDSDTGAKKKDKTANASETVASETTATEILPASFSADATGSTSKIDILATEAASTATTAAPEPTNAPVPASSESAATDSSVEKPEVTADNATAEPVSQTATTPIESEASSEPSAPSTTSASSELESAKAERQRKSREVNDTQFLRYRRSLFFGIDETVMAFYKGQADLPSATVHLEKCLASGHFSNEILNLYLETIALAAERQVVGGALDVTTPLTRVMQHFATLAPQYEWSNIAMNHVVRACGSNAATLCGIEGMTLKEAVTKWVECGGIASSIQSPELLAFMQEQGIVSLLERE